MNKNGLFTFTTPNLGDDMQSLAVLAHLSGVDSFLNRDLLADAKVSEPMNSVFNSWFLLGDDYRPPMSELSPIWHGFHAKEGLVAQPAWRDYLKSASGPIGCRDLFTRDNLLSAGIPAYFSGCLTLFLGQHFPRPDMPRQGVVFLDVPPEVEEYIPQEILRKAVRLSTFVPHNIGLSAFNRFAATSEIASRLASAELVVTRRLHAALPAASFGTPVVAVPDAKIAAARTRFSGYDSILPVIFLEEAASQLPKLDWLHIPTATIPNEVKAAYETLKSQLETRGILGGAITGASVLDRPKHDRQRLANKFKTSPRGKIRVRLGPRFFELSVKSWSDRVIEVALSGFPGLSRLNLRVEGTRTHADNTWVDWGSLSDLCDQAAEM